MITKKLVYVLCLSVSCLLIGLGIVSPRINFAEEQV